MKLSFRNWQVPILVAVIAILASGCFGPTIPVTLQASKTIVSLGEHINIECILPDVTGNVTYDWSSRGGSIEGDGVVADWSSDAAGDYTIKVEVKGENGERGKAALTITVNDNYGPVVEDLVVTAENPKYLSNKRVLKNQKYYIECIAEDEDGDELSYSWSCDEGKISGDGAKITWTAPGKKAAPILTVMVMDEKGGSTTESIEFDVKTCGCAFK